MIQFLHIIEMQSEQEESAAPSGDEPESTKVQENESADSELSLTEEENGLLNAMVALRLIRS